MSLIHLLNASLISDGDEVFFHFKNNYFSGYVDKLGMIRETRCNNIVVFLNKMPFENLTEWADACIQEIAKEYITRFSAWKRCTHKNSGLVLNNLRQLCGVFAVQKIPVTNATITTLQQTISLLLKHVDLLKEQNKSYQKYIYGEADDFNENKLQLPNSIMTIAKLYDGYISAKLDTQAKMYIGKHVDKNIAQQHRSELQLTHEHTNPALNNTSRAVA